MSDRKEAMLTYEYSHGNTDYDDKYLRHTTINNYFFKDAENIKYRWSTRNSVGLFPEKEYKIQFKLLRKGIHGEFVIGYLKIYELAKNTYGQELWREVRQYNSKEQYH